MVAGGEHFAAPLCLLTCAAAPTSRPVSGCTIGADDTTGLMLARFGLPRTLPVSSS